MLQNVTQQGLTGSDKKGMLATCSWGEKTSGNTEKGREVKERRKKTYALKGQSN